MCGSISANYSTAQDLVNLPLFFSFVYSVTPMTTPQNAISKQTMSSIWLVFHTSTAMTKMAGSEAVCGQTCYLHPERLQWPLMCLCLFLWRPMKGTNMVNKLSQMQQTTPCLIQDESPSPGQEDIYISKLKEGTTFVNIRNRKVACKNYNKKTYRNPIFPHPAVKGMNISFSLEEILRLSNLAVG